MVAVVGTYQNGYVKLDKEYSSESPVKVIVTFLEEVVSESNSYLSLSDFSFSPSQKNLKKFKGSLTDSILEERRAEL
ncbi:MAG: hypothetical protein KKG00_13345 [Bacteroidetes bacterium]|nr:hypothetical protein [Bacteroidota bacterium]